MAREAKVLITSTNNIDAGIKSAVKDLTSLESNAVRIGKAIQSAFTATAIIALGKKIVDFGLECVTAFGEAERSLTQLKTALGGSDAAFARMNELIGEMGFKTLASKDDVEALVAQIASLGKSEGDVRRITEASIALSNITGQSLDSAFKTLNGTFVGTTKEIKKLIPEIGTLTKEQLASGVAVDLVNAKFGKISDDMGKGISQSVKNLSDAFGDLKETIGQGWAEAMKPMTDAVTEAVNKMVADLERARKAQKGLADKVDLAGAVAEGNLPLAKKLAEGMTVMALQDAYDMAKKANPLATKGQQAALDEIFAILRTKAIVAPVATTVPAKSAAGGTSAATTPAQGWDMWGAAGFSDAFLDTSRDTKDLMDGLYENSGDMVATLDLSEERLLAIARELQWGNDDRKKSKEYFIPNGKLKIAGQTGADPGGMSGLSTGQFGGSGDGGDAISKLVASFGGIDSILKRVGGSLSMITQMANPLILMLKGFFDFFDSAMVKTIKPLFDVIYYIGAYCAEALYPILNSLGGIFNFVSFILLNTLAPVLKIISPIIEFVAGLLNLILIPILKSVAIMFEVVMAPVKWVGDLFKWVGKILATFVDNIVNHLFGGAHAYANFSSDAFTALGDRIAAIWNATFVGTLTPTLPDLSDFNNVLTPLTTGTSPFGDNTASATYTGAQTIIFNFFNQGNVVGTGGLEELAILIDGIIKRNARYA